MNSSTLRDKLRFIFNIALVTTMSIAAILAYGEYQGFLDIRFYSTKELQYQARLHRAQAEIARYAVSGGEGDVQIAQEEPAPTQPTVWDALKHKRSK